ncbi:TLC domain-containing protein 4-B [Pristis pectinata]|uniref:TLC domain-containing protein 4-B n=1 Tax=Pristis pectinata TaxID=685728 RepID=UPI00223D64B6|nr:TLC domain-containing protein 4-B [Pristis pectinata]
MQRRGPVVMASLDWLVVAVTSFTIFQILFHYLSAKISVCFCNGYRTLTDIQKVEWNSRVVSTFHALLVGLLCLYLLWFDDAVNADPIWGDPTLVKLNVGLAAGYFIQDFLLILWYWKAIGDIYFVIHHLTALYAYYYVLGEGMLPYFANFRLIAEFSTPFVNQRWFFEVLGYPKTSKPNIINGFLMALIFFLVRIAVMPPYYNKMISTFGTEAFNKLGLQAQLTWIIASICLDVMNLMWMHKIGKGCHKVLLACKKEKADIQENGKQQ